MNSRLRGTGNLVQTALMDFVGGECGLLLNKVILLLCPLVRVCFYTLFFDNFGPCWCLPFPVVT